MFIIVMLMMVVMMVVCDFRVSFIKWLVGVGVFCGWCFVVV